MDNEKINAVPEEENEAQATPNEVTEEPVEAAEEAKEVSSQEEEINGEPYEDAQETAEESKEETAEEENENSEEEITEEENEEEEILPENLCPVCEEREKGEDSDYCPECEAEMLSRKAPLLGWLGGLMAIVFSIFALGLTILVSAPSIQVARGDSLAKEKCWYSAYKEYSEVPSVVDEINAILGSTSQFAQTGSGLNIKIIETVANCYSPLDALSIADNLLGEDSVEKFGALKKYTKVRDDYLATYEALMEPIEAMSYGEADAATTYAAFEKARSAEGVNGIYIDYFLFNAAVYYGDTNAVKLKYLDAVDAAAKGGKEDYSWLYYQDYASLLYEEGETEKALQYLDELTESDRTKFGAYEMKMRIAFGQGDKDEASRVLAEFKKYNEGFDTAYTLEAMFLRATGELEKAKTLISEALEQYDSVPELHRQLALVYLLEGDYDNAYESVFKADNNAYYLYAYMGDSSAYTPQLNNTLYLCTYLEKLHGSKTTENSLYIDEILNSFAEEDLSPEVISIVNGEKTVEEVLTEGACDLA